MKNNFFFFKLIILILLFNYNSFVYSDQLIFDAKNVKILNEGEITTAENGTAKLIDENIIIEGEKFTYDNLNKLLKVKNSKIFLNDHNLIINSNETLLNEKTSSIEAIGKVLIDYNQSDYRISTEKLTYNYKKKLINSKTNTKLI